MVAPDRELRIDLIPTVCDAFEQLPIIGILTFDFVARQHIRQVTAFVALGLEHARRQRCPSVEYGLGVDASRLIESRGAEGLLEQHPKSLEHPVFTQMSVEADQ